MTRNISYRSTLLLVWLPLIIKCFQTSRFQARDLSSCSPLRAKSKLNPLEQQRILSEKAAKYIQMRELQKLRKEGGSYDDVKNLLVNGTNAAAGDPSLAKKGYQRYVGKGTLDQRLRAVIAYKRSSVAAESMLADGSGGLTVDEEQELEAMMESEDGDYEPEEDDEEAIYESMVLKIIEEAKLDELKRNFLLDKQAINDAREDEKEAIAAAAAETPSSQQKADQSSTDSATTASTSTTGGKAVQDDDELYTPARSSWGVFQRPRDISKTFGGGRVISKEEMDRMDEELERSQKESEKQKQVFITAAQKTEVENEDKIRDALTTSRGYMNIGNRKMAVATLEAVQDLCSWHTDFGGEVLLELGMALETVERSEDARKVYGKLISISWSQKVRRNALALLQGLDIAKKIRKSGALGPQKPIMDYANMHLVSETLKQGLKNEWDDYKRKEAPVTPWFDDGSQADKTVDRVETFRDAYFLLLRLTNPLKKVSSESMAKALRKMYITPADEKVTMLRNKGLLAEQLAGKKKVGQRIVGSGGANPADSPDNVLASMARRITSEMTANAEMMGKKVNNFSPAPASLTNPQKAVQNEPASLFAVVGALDPILTDSYEKNVNGTWDLVASLVDKAPYTAKRFESGMVRRILDFPNAACVEEVPVMWGLSTARLWSSLEWSGTRGELTLSGGQIQQSQAPWQSKKGQQSFQVVFCDDTLLISREPSEKVTEPDLYAVWKRVLPTVWRKY